MKDTVIAAQLTQSAAVSVLGWKNKKSIGEKKNDKNNNT